MQVLVSLIPLCGVVEKYLPSRSSHYSKGLGYVFYFHEKNAQHLAQICKTKDLYSGRVDM
jgi:hypothetical protein